MNADRLREAAKVLRERAEAAARGPWQYETHGDGIPPNVYNVDSMVVADTFDKPHLSDARYIATMHPGVGLLVADWLDDAATWEQIPRTVNHDMKAHDIADLILGGQR